MSGRQWVRRVQRHPDASYDRDDWPYCLPPVARLLEDGLDLRPGVTFMVGENGSGKSTLVEAIATAAGLNPEGGSRAVRHETRASESPLHEVLQLVRSPGAAGAAYFLRAETMHGLYTYLEDLPVTPRVPRTRLHELSHGESFLHVLGEHFSARGSTSWTSARPRCRSPPASPSSPSWSGWAAAEARCCARRTRRC